MTQLPTIHRATAPRQFPCRRHQIHTGEYFDLAANSASTSARPTHSQCQPRVITYCAPLRIELRAVDRYSTASLKTRRYMSRRLAIRRGLDAVELADPCPPRAISASCVPTSTTRAPSSTTIRSAIRTVEKRCDTRMVMRPSAVVAAHRGGVALEQRVLGFGVERGGRLVEHQHERLDRA